MGLLIDSFAGGGGASLGIEMALERKVDIAINHDPHAIEMHRRNHPTTRHVLEDVWRADLKKLVGRRAVDLLWLSPDCRHFSRAAGAAPVSESVRSLAWIACKWAAQVRPRVIALENVREFASWGPVVPRWVCRACNWRGTEGQTRLARVRRRCPRCNSLRLTRTEDLIPDPDRRGQTFKRFVGRLRGMGYEVQWRDFDAADYGAPTHRRRLFLVARRDGIEVRWPQPTHGDPARIAETRRRPWRTAASCIDWSLPCPSIFDRERPLAPNTLRRIAHGVKRYVLESASPFIVRLGQTGGGGMYVNSGEQPLTTVTSKAEHCLVEPRLLDTGDAAAFMAKHYGGVVGRPIDEPSPTNTGSGCQNQIVALSLAHMNHGDKQWSGVDEPSRTVTTGGHQALVAALLQTHYGQGERNPNDARVSSLEQGVPTVTGAQRHGVVAANLVWFNHEHAGRTVEEPMPTLMTSGRVALVYSFLVRYFGTAIGQSLTEPLYTITGKDRFGLVLVRVDGRQYVVVDIGMRMLTPRELANAQGFPRSYVLTGSKTKQVKRIGNSVCPDMAAAIVRANLGPEAVRARRGRARTRCQGS